MERSRDALANWPLVDENNQPICDEEGNALQLPTEDELKAAYGAAARAARVANEAARAAQKQWELLQKDHTTDTRAEDSLIRYLSDPRGIDWHRMMKRSPNMIVNQDILWLSTSEPLTSSFHTLTPL
jgi:hypothetical protein